MNKQEFETLQARLHMAHADQSEEASKYRLGTRNPIFVIQKLEFLCILHPEYNSINGECDIKDSYCFHGEGYDSLDEIKHAFDSDDEYQVAFDNGEIQAHEAAYQWQDKLLFLTKEAAEEYLSKCNENCFRLYVKSTHKSSELTDLLELIANGKLQYIEEQS